MFTKILTALGLAPKNLDEARSTYTEAKATLDSVSALFTAAGLNLEQILAAGPDSLKAHLESIDNTEELAEALQENERINLDLDTANATLATARATGEVYQSVFSTLGLAHADLSEPAKIKTAFAAHVEKQTTLALAKTGHPPAHVPAATSPVDDITTKSDPDKAALAAFDQYLALIEADNKDMTGASAIARTQFYAQNHAAITRGMQLRKRS